MSAVFAPKPAIGAAEWALRVQLAGAYRIAHHLRWSELIYPPETSRRNPQRRVLQELK